MDEEAFRNAFLEWRNGTWLPERKKIVEKICQDDENRDRLRQLTERMEGNVIVPFVGAGLSVPSGFKLWAAFLHQLREHCVPPLTEDDLNQILRTPGGYEQAAEKIITGMPRRLFDERFEGYSRLAELSDVNGCVRFLPLLFNGNGLTTNFDNVLELVYNGYHCPFGQILNGKQVADWQTHVFRRETVLLKIHGHATQPETRILTATEYAAAYAPGCPLRATMEAIIRNSAFLFLGCSLGSDRTMDLMKEVFANDPTLTTRNYAFLPMPKDALTRHQRDAFLAERAIFPIWYGDYGETGKDFDHNLHIEALLVELLDRQGKIDTLYVSPEEPIRIQNR